MPRRQLRRCMLVNRPQSDQCATVPLLVTRSRRGEGSDMSCRRLLLLAALFAIAGDAGTNETATCELLKSRHLAIQVRINGHGPYRMIFDTGSPVVLISSRVAEEC